MAERRDSIRVHIAGREYFVVGGEFQDMLTAIKQINGRRFVSELKAWQLPGALEQIQNQLDISGYQLEGGKPLDEPAQTAQPAQASFGSDRIRVTLQGHELAVTGGSFKDMLEAVKAIPGRRYDGERKIWELPGEAGIIQGLIQAAGFELEGADKISPGSVPPSEPLRMSSGSEPPPYEPPDFFDDDDIPPYEPPDWWDDDNLPPPMEPSTWEADEWTAAPSPEPDLFEPAPASAAGGSAPRSGDQIRIRVGGIPLMVTGGEFKAMLEVIKKIPGRRFDSQDKTWDIPEDISIDSVQQAVNAAGFVLKRG